MVTFIIVVILLKDFRVIESLTQVVESLVRHY